MLGNGTGDMNAEWTDIDFEQHSVNVHPKPEYDWIPKGEAREEDIVLQGRFMKRMKARQIRGAGSTLVFPTATNRANMHLIKIVQRVRNKAGIKDKRIMLHAIRRTVGTMVTKECGIEQARIWPGHSGIETKGSPALVKRHHGPTKMGPYRSRLILTEEMPLL